MGTSAFSTSWRTGAAVSRVIKTVAIATLSRSVDKKSNVLMGDEICDFVWQHQYHKNWINYSDKENEKLNKANRKRQKTVTLPSKDDKKKIVVYLDEMYHINQVSSIEQPIRCLIYNDNFYSWLWKDDDGNWRSYRPHIVFFLEVAYQRKEKTFKFYENADYVINFDKFIQINEKTSHTRCILREQVDIVLSLKKFNQDSKNKEFKKMCFNESLNFDENCISLPAVSTACSLSHELKPSDTLNASLTVLENDILNDSPSKQKLTLKRSDELCNFVWQHQYHKNWVSYSDKENGILNKAVKKRQKTVTLPSKDDKKKIVVHLDEMYHINQISSIEQPIRCLIYNNNFYSWLWKDDDGNWRSYRPHIVFFLEVAYQRKEKTFKFYENADYLVDFENFIQIDEKTSHNRCILREQVDIALSLKTFNHTLINEEFQKMCLNESLNFEKRCINLPALSSTACSMTLELQPSNILNDSLAVLENDSAEQYDLKLYECILPADNECPNRDNFHIYCEEGSAFSATLSLANILNNSNKYCILQLLKHNKKNQYSLLQRLGRVGTRGQHEFINYESCIFHAKADFEAKFFEKTKNRWSKKNSFFHFHGKYDLLDVDLSPELEKNDVAANLDPSIENFLVMICDRKAMADIMKEMSYDSSNTPLGKLTSKQIKQGYIALNKIVQVTSQDDTGCALVNACDEFYTKIPHNFGKKCPPLIRTVDDIKEKLRMLEALSNIRIATKTMNSIPDAMEHPLNKYYKSLKCDLEPLNSLSIEYSAVVGYLKNSHGPTHTNYKMEVIDVFKCHSKEESSLNRNNNKILLWHGSRITNWAGILRRGLCIAPPEAPHIGCMFGKGLYFADVSSKSANYCFATKKKNKGLLLLCEVNVGQQLHLTEADENLPKSLPACYDSVLGKGKFTPIGYQYGSLSKAAKEPIFQLVEDTRIETYLNYNEYVVYNTDLVEMKYLLVIKFNFKDRF